MSAGRIEGEQVLLRVFVGESDRWEGRPLHAALLELLRRRGLAGATVLRAVAGFGPRARVHTASIEGLAADLPLVIEAVDSEARIEAVLPEVRRMTRGGLVTLEKARVIRYASGAGP